MKVHVPPEADPASATISIHRYGSATRGTAWFDDFSLTYLRPPAIETFLMHPNFRGYLSADEPATVRLWVRRDAAQTRAPIRVEVREASGGQVVASKTSAGDVSRADRRAGFRRVAPGQLRRGSAHGRFCSAADRRSRRSPPQQRQRVLRVVRCEPSAAFPGQPVFPIGLYNTTRQFYNRDEEFDWPPRRRGWRRWPKHRSRANINYWFWAPSIEVRGSTSTR